ncbi:MAG TPA: cysteine desulfurase family protein [Lacipirellulaceae bacterium]|nr:cysteine desulfurase family protein [Lacipirellulaceae bacterium]
MTPIYLDNAATTPIRPEAADAVRDASLRYGANPASQHDLGRQARRALEAARSRIAELLGATGKDQVIFTSGGTEANNLALTGLAGWPIQNLRPSANDAASRSAAGQAPLGVRPERIVVSGLEHPSVSLTAEALRLRGWQIDTLAAEATGVTTTGYFDGLGGSVRARLVSVMLGNNETGVLQPVAQIAATCRAAGVLIHTDAVQVVGKIAMDFRALGVDALSVAAHKFHGPLGVGALIVKHGTQLAPLMQGGFQQQALRPGTESVPLAEGMCAALEAAHRDLDERCARITTLRMELERRILAADERAVVIGSAAHRLPHISNIAFVGLDRQALAMALDLDGIACSTGSACASGSSEPSPALVAMGLPTEQIRSSIRFSLGATTTAADIDEAARRILAVVKRLRHRK